MAVRYYLLAFCMLLAAGQTHAQKRTKRARPAPTAVPHVPNKLDSLTTAAQVQLFVRSQGPGYGSFSLQQLPEKQADGSYVGAVLDPVTKKPVTAYYSGLQLCLMVHNLSSWAKADFDANGQTDLLVVGSYGPGNMKMIRCFLGEGPGNFRSVRLDKRPSLYEGASLIQVQGKPAIQLARLEPLVSVPTHNKDFVCRADTVLHDQTGFIEYNAHPKDYRIQKIAFKTTPCFGRCPVFKLEIDDHQLGKYEAIKHIENPGIFTATIDNQSFQQLWALVNYINFPALHDIKSYNNLTGDQYHDAPVHSITVTYADGKQKMMGNSVEGAETLGLQRVYDLFFTLQTSQAWK